MNKPVVEFQNICFSYSENKPILKNINFQIYDNEYVCIIGHNGSGKSTISKVLVGLLKPQSGVVKLLGENINAQNIKNLRNNVGIVFQNPDNQFVGLLVKDDIAFGLENRKVPQEEINNIINIVAETVGIEHLLEKSPEDLSGGQKQKVAIAGVLAINPKITIFDESTSMLDPKSKRELKELIYDLKTKAKKTIISITHDMEEVLLADRVIVLEKGQIVLNGSPSEIFLENIDIEKYKLDYPFVFQLSKLLNKNNIKIKPTLNKDELINQLCKKRKK